MRRKKYFSSDILNEQISIIGKSILRTLTHEIQDVQWFSIIVDQTINVTNQEQFNISFQWVREHFIVDEDPIGMVAVQDTAGDTLFRVVKDSLIRMNFPIIFPVEVRLMMGQVTCKGILKV